MARPHALLVSALLAGGVLAACGDGEPTAARTTSTTAAAPADDGAGSGTSVVIERSRFEPREIRVAPGDTVTFENVDPFAHTVTSTDASPLAFDSGEFADGAVFQQTFDEPGEYPYFCEIHPTMRAAVIVG